MDRRIRAIGPALVGLAACGEPFETGGTGGGAGSSAGTVTGAGAAGVGGDEGTGASSATVGCSDGTREALLDEPDVAGCAGAFDLPGVTPAAAHGPHCGWNAGNDSTNPGGVGCSVDDLCSPSWHPCASTAEFTLRAAVDACPAAGVDPVFWLTGQAEDATGQCALGGQNNLVGCGALLGRPPADAACAPFVVEMGWSECAETGVWYCGAAADASREAAVVTKGNPSQGGVLCCRD